MLKELIGLCVYSFKTLVIVFISHVLMYNLSYSQTGQENSIIDSELKTRTVGSVSKLLLENYIFPNIAKEMGDYINANLQKGAYDDISDPMDFAQQLTADLLKISNDKHIKVFFSPDRVKEMKEYEKIQLTPEEEDSLFIEELKPENFGFKKVEILPGNIGYIDFRRFAPANIIEEKVFSIMEFLKDTDAIIFDMRYNSGGSASGVQLVCSYLFGEEPVHLNDLYFRPADTTEQFWTLKEIRGKRLPDIPVYILISSSTFSGAEEFSYNLKTLNRATLVGQTTGGGAHPGGPEIVNDYYYINIPKGRAINPHTKTNWEGTGVSPDVDIDSRFALTKAHILALEKILSKGTNDQLITQLSFLIESLKESLDVSEVDLNTLKSYVGSYGERKITYENGQLYFQRGWRQTYEMSPISEDTFMLMDIPYFRIKFDRDASGNVTGITGIYDDGHTDNTPKN